MIKKQKEKTLLEKNPYIYYMTNWGFVEKITKVEKTQNQKR